jgi:DnaJ-related protein SCJ1
MADGEVITFDGAADQHPDMMAGDIKFVIKTRPHDIYTRKGDNLYVKEVITLVEALVGFKHQLTHLDGTKVELHRSGVTPPGYVQQINNQGMPVYNGHGERGKLFVEYSVVFPVGMSFSPTDKEQITKMFGGVSSAEVGSDQKPTPHNDL